MNPSDRQVIESVFAGDGEMASRMRALDWSATPLGPVEQWPLALRTCVRIALNSAHAMNICWGPDYINIYNDAYLPSMGANHPWALGRPARDVVPEVWELVRPLFDTVAMRGRPFSSPADQLFPFERNNYLEEYYPSFSLNPLPDDNGNVGGVLVVFLETTERVLEERRRNLLRDLASRTAAARTEKEVWRVSAKTLGENYLSLPFAFLYEYRPQEHHAYLTGASVEAEEALRPPVINCRSENLWRFDPGLPKDGILVELGDRASSVAVPNWPETPKHAFVAPIRLGEYGETLGFLVAGIHPGRAFDEAYRQFVYRITEQITIGLTSTRAYEQERQRGELERERLRASEEKLAEANRLYLEQQRAATELQIQVDLLQQLPVSAWTLKPDGTPDFVNRVWLEFAGQTLDFVRSRPEAWMTVVHPDDRERVTKFFWEGVSSGKGFAFENRDLRAEDGTYRWHLQQAVPLRDAQGNVLKFVGTTTDIDDQKRAEEALAELDRAKTTFFSNVSHEFRTPLTLMLGPLDEVLPEASERLSPEHLELLVAARRNGIRLLKLVNTLLDFSRIEAGRVQASYQPTDLATFTSEIASAFDSVMKNAGLRLTVECEPISEPVYVDRDLWEKIVLNLLSNAYKFTLAGEVALTLKPRDGAVELQVRDTGVGIPGEHLEHVFERFHRIQITQARAYEGTGIGLALVQELVKLHGGGVHVESAVGAGSTFTVTIPGGKEHLPAERIQAATTLDPTTIRAEAYVEEARRWSRDESGVAVDEEMPAKRPSPASPPEPNASERRELIVVADDNADMRQYLTRLLSERYEVHAVVNGRRALEATQRLHPALVLADVMMPQLDGFGLLRAIRVDSLLASTPVILVSARAGEESRVEGLEADADDYLIKPFAARELLARVAAHVKMANLRRETAEREERLRSEAKLEREKLRASEERLAETSRLYADLQRADAELRLQVELLQQLPVSAWTLNPDGTPDFVNRVWLEFSGQALDFVRSHQEAWMTAVHPEDREMAAKSFWEGVQTGRDFAFETRSLRAKDGNYRWHLQQAVALRDAEGRVLKFVGTTTDIDDQKRAEEKIRQSEKEARQLLDLSPLHISELGPDGERLYTNRASLEYFGITLEEWQNADRRRVLHPQDAGLVINELLAKLQSGSPFEYEVRLKRKDGQYRWFHYRLSPMSNDQERITRWYAAGTDIHDRKLAEQRLEQENISLREEIDKASMFEEIVGVSAPLKQVLSSISKVAPTDSSVLITGETGTGKELVARAIHGRSGRSSHAFVSVNCAVIPRDLVASELFGHEKGAFTGATQRRLGRFELAEKGTIFLDEVGELPAETQIALLRVLQEHEFQRVGGTDSIRTDVRVIAATNRDLESAIELGRFRSDLFYRLNVFPVELPPLRKRSEDIPLLITYFLNRYARKAGRHFTAVDKKSLDLLQSYAWPGNIRELQNVIERSVIVSESQTFSVDASWLSRRPSASDVQPSLSKRRPAQERAVIEAALRESRGRVYGPSGAAVKLGISRTTLESKIRSLKIDKNRFKDRFHCEGPLADLV